MVMATIQISAQREYRNGAEPERSKGVEDVKSVVRVCLPGLILASVAGGQDSPKPALRPGVSVQMAVASHAVEMRAADEQDATVIAITANGRVYVGVTPTELNALGNLSAAAVYEKPDARVQYQKVLAVLDALHGRQVVLLTAPPEKIEKGTYIPPYGIKLTVSR